MGNDLHPSCQVDFVFNGYRFWIDSVDQNVRGDINRAEIGDPYAPKLVEPGRKPKGKKHIIGGVAEKGFPEEVEAACIIGSFHAWVCFQSKGGRVTKIEKNDGKRIPGEFIR